MPRTAAAPHFHLNLLSPARSVRSTRALIEAFLTFLHDQGHRSVYGQVVTYATRRINRGRLANAHFA
jgi:hypothetical protein